MFKVINIMYYTTYWLLYILNLKLTVVRSTECLLIREHDTILY